MNCSGCGNDKAWHVKSYYDKREGFRELCDACGLEGGGEGIPDVYFAGRAQKFANLTDDMGRPIEITSKRHKKEVMDRLGVSEVGDRVNGAPYGSKDWISGSAEYRKRNFEKDRPKIREIYKSYLDRARKGR